MRHFRWCVLGTGSVASKFTLGLLQTGNARVEVVASRSLERAQKFAQALGIPRAVGSYEEAAHLNEIDAVYIATPASKHRDHALLCLNANKPVIVEKPFALNSNQAQEIIETARARSIFCMEGMWTRFMPLVQAVKQMIAEGAIGDVQMFTGSFCVADAFHNQNSLYNLELGGGALLHRGVYPISLAYYLLGAPDTVLSNAVIGKTGVDEQTAVIFRYRAGCHALLHASLRTQSSNDCVIMGTRAKLHIQTPIYRPFQMTLTPIQERIRTLSNPSKLGKLKENHWIQNIYQRLNRVALPLFDRKSKDYAIWYTGNGYHYEAEEVMKCISDGKIESEIMPLSESLSIMKTMDFIRSQWISS